MKYDIVVIGGGLGGYVAAIKAAQMGKNTCLIERSKLGGTCLNVGCIPTKVLLKSAEMVQEIKHAAEYGVRNIQVEDAILDLSAVQERKNTIVTKMVSGVSGLMRKNKITVMEGTASFLDRNTVQVGDQKVEGSNFIIATGSKAKSLPIPIDAGMPFYTSTELLELKEAPKSIAVIGGGVIGVELAYFLSSIGVKVTIIEFLDRILPMVDQEITEPVNQQFLDLGMTIFTGAKVTAIEKDKVLFEQNGSLQGAACDAVLMAVGRQPQLDGLNLEAIGVTVERGAIVTNDKMATNVPCIYAIGDVNGKSMYAHTASMEGIAAVENICGHAATVDYGKIPGVIYIKPEIASIGLTEEQARAKYSEIKVGRFPMSANAKANIEGDDRGLVKIITEARYGEIVGAHFYCIHASDLISEMSAAMRMECTAEELIKAVHPHPSIAEVIHEASHGAVHKPIHN